MFDLAGDCQLLQKIYFEVNNHDSLEDNHKAPMRYLDKNRTKIEYLNEKNEKVIDNKGIQLGKKLANNLQNSLPFL